MSATIERLVTNYEGGHISRREFVASLSALAIAQPAAAAQTSAPVLPARTLNHVALRVSNVQRSQDFYQKLFGMKALSTRGATPILPIGSGPEYMALSAARAGVTPSIYHFCLGIERFDPDRVMKTLADQGIKGRVTMQDGKVPLLYFTDPDHIEVQLQDVSYCGGSGPLGNVCP